MMLLKKNMTNQRIFESFSTLFNSHAIIFWHDIEAEFTSILENIQLNGVRLIHLEATPVL